MSKVYDWFEERLEIQSIADDISSKYVPPHVNIFYCLGLKNCCVFSQSPYRSIHVSVGMCLTFIPKQ